MKSLAHVNAASLSPPRSRYQLSILQSNNNDTRSPVFVEVRLLRPSLDCFSASTPKKPAKRSEAETASGGLTNMDVSQLISVRCGISIQFSFHIFLYFRIICVQFTTLLEFTSVAA